MISSEILPRFNINDDYRKTICIQNENNEIHSVKRMKTFHTIKYLAEEFFFKSHPFSDLILIVQGNLNMINVSCIEKHAYFR